MRVNKDINLLSIIKSNTSFISSCVFTITLLSLIYSFIVTPYYSSYTSIYRIKDDQSFGNLSGMAGLATTLGINIDTNDGFDFYIPDIVDSRTLKRNIILKKWYSESFADSVTLIDYWGISSNPGLVKGILGFFDDQFIAIDEDIIKQNRAIENLENLLSVQENESGLFIVSVSMQEPKLSTDISNYIAEYIQKYIADRMNERALKNKEFLDSRLLEAKNELSNSENKLMKFQETHFLTDENPKIQLERARILRNVEVNQQVYITLRQQFELANINHLQEKPIVNVLDKAVIPPRPIKPQKFRILLAGFLCSLIGSIYFKYIQFRFF